MDYNQILLETILKKTGIYITNKNDCRTISQIIANEKIGYLSESTLYRFFLLKHNNNKPYKNTLNILAKFCGFSSWNDFINYYDTNLLFNNVNFLNNTFSCLIDDFIKKEKFNSLIDIYESVENETYKTKEFIGLQTFKKFQMLGNFPLFIKNYGQHTFVRNILIESLYDPQHRIKGYTESLGFYLDKATTNSSNYLQDFIFTNAVLFRHYYLNHQAKTLEIGKKLFDLPLQNSEFNTLHIFPKSRYLAYKIWFLKLLKSKQSILNDYLEFVLSWIKEEYEKTNSIIELNIIYQTFTEVTSDQKLYEFENQIVELYHLKITNLHSPKLDVNFVNNANGLINLLPA